jgi:hypothetical protein
VIMSGRREAWVSEALGSGVADKLVSLLQGLGLEVEAEECEVDIEWEGFGEALDAPC